MLVFLQRVTIVETHGFPILCSVKDSQDMIYRGLLNDSDLYHRTKTDSEKSSIKGSICRDTAERCNYLKAKWLGLLLMRSSLVYIWPFPNYRKQGRSSLLNIYVSGYLVAFFVFSHLYKENFA